MADNLAPTKINISIISVQNENKLKTKADWSKPYVPKHSISIENNETNRRFVQLLQRLVMKDDYSETVEVSLE